MTTASGDGTSDHDGGAWVQVSPHADCVVVTVGGEVDVLSAGKLANALQTAATASRVEPMIVDMTHLEFIDSSGLGVLIKASNRAEVLGDVLVLVDPPSLVQRLLTGTQLKHRFAIYDTLDAALASIRAF